MRSRRAANRATGRDDTTFRHFAADALAATDMRRPISRAETAPPPRPWSRPCASSSASSRSISAFSWPMRSLQFADRQQRQVLADLMELAPVFFGSSSKIAMQASSVA